MNLTRSGIVAGVFFSESVLRYAVVNHENGRTLQKLGSCEFEFDLLIELKAGLQASARSTLVAALNDILTDTGASEVVVGVHPSLARTYYTLVDGNSSPSARSEQFSREGKLLFSESDSYHALPQTLHHVIDEDGSGMRRDWNMVTLLPATVREGIEDVFGQCSSTANTSYQSTLECARRIVNRYDIASTQGNTFSLLIGQFNSVLEMALLYEGAIVHGHTIASKSPEDFFYWLIVLATRLDLSPSLISSLYVFGDDVDVSQLERAVRTLHAKVIRVDPIKHADLKVTSVRPDFDPARYAACIGAAL